MYAVISTGGKQYRLSEGDVVRVEKLSGDVGEQVVFEDVQLLSGDEGTVLGSTDLGEARVLGTILEQSRGDKIVVFKFKRRKMYRRRTGHRQSLTSVRIDAIETKAGKAEGVKKSDESAEKGAEKKSQAVKAKPVAKKQAAKPKAKKAAPSEAAADKQED